MKNRKQHYVPQYYLRNFSNENQINVFDIKSKSKFSNSINNLSYKKFFYNVDLDLLNKFLLEEKFEKPDIIDDLIRENNEELLAPFIHSFNKTAERLESDDSRKSISIIDSFSLVDFALVQLYRNPKLLLFYRTIKESFDKKFYKTKDNFENTLLGLILIMLFSKLHYGKTIKLKKEIEKSFSLILDEFQLMKDDITNSYKMLYHNRSDIQFLTCDSPIGMVRTNPINTFSIMTIPVNPRVAFMCVNKRAYPEVNDKNSTIIEIDNSNKNQVNSINLSTINNAKRFIYSKNGEFPDESQYLKYKDFWNY